VATAADRAFMHEAVSLAGRGLNACEPNPRVGCVIVDRDGAVAGRGFHARAGGPHAEVVALAQAGRAAAGGTAYVTLEPCCHHGRTPPCTDALLASGVRRVVVAVGDPHPAVAGGGLRRLREAGVTVSAGVLEDEAREVNRGFLRRLAVDRPFVTVKLATSLDGATAMADGESRWITGAAARRDVHLRRARSGAILTGVGTVLADDPALTVRDVPDDAGEWEMPLRVVLDSSLRTPPRARLLAAPGTTLLCHTGAAAPARRVDLAEAGAELVCVPGARDRVPLAPVLEMLAARGVNELLVEAGGSVNGALLEGGFVDEIVWYAAPHVMGADTLPAWRLPGVRHMADRIRFHVRSCRMVGEDLRIIAHPHRIPGDADA
jgi:diaminohydroxyphosphoribosylaminopyrimidine deaminase/5-amino-6-(5-phosphoribosylamino)uracil reductase